MRTGLGGGGQLPILVHEDGPGVSPWNARSGGHCDMILNGIRWYEKTILSNDGGIYGERDELTRARILARKWGSPVLGDRRFHQADAGLVT